MKRLLPLILLALATTVFGQMYFVGSAQAATVSTDINNPSLTRGISLPKSPIHY
jgi:hypothetical protein